MAEFPYGYGSDRLSYDELEAKTTYKRLHPEVRRRFRALIEYLASKGTPLGVGTGWRVQPTGRKGFAAPGNSYHESFPAGSSEANALAIDSVPASSWNAMEPVLERFGLRSFRNVNNEPWHIQPIEIPGSRRRATVCPPLRTWALPGKPAPAAGQPAKTTSVKAVAPNVPVPTLRSGSSGLQVRQLIDVLKFWRWYPAEHMGDGNDGRFGGRTDTGVKAMQRALRIGADGVYGPQTQRALAAFTKAGR